MLYWLGFEKFLWPCVDLVGMVDVEIQIGGC